MERLGALRSHICGQRPGDSRRPRLQPAAAVDVQLSDPPLILDGARGVALGLLSAEQMREFVRTGLVAVQLDDLPASVHKGFYDTARALDDSNTKKDLTNYNGADNQALGGVTLRRDPAVAQGDPGRCMSGDLEDAMNTVFRSTKFHGALASVLGPDFMVGNNWKDDGSIRARSHCRFVLLRTHFTPDSLT